MRMPLLLVATALLSGCAPVHVQQRLISTSWDTVRALPQGTEVGIALDDAAVLFGRLQDVSAEGLEIRRGGGVERIGRTQVMRLAVRTPTGSSRVPNVIKGAVAGAVVGGLIAWLVHSIEENPQGNGGAWAGMLLTTGGGAALGSQWPPAVSYDERVVYIRP
jgi:hypothetical protein